MNSLLNRYKELGQEFSPQEVTIRQALRVNTLKISEKELVLRLQEKGVTLEKIPFVTSGYYFEAPFSLASTEEYLLGYIYMQEAASQLPAEVLLTDIDKSKDKRSIKILDLCAAPGSKTTQLAQLTNDETSIIAVDESLPRLQTLQYNLERLGISSVATFKKDGRFIDDLNLMFDYILIDAPCSGNFCIEENYFSTRTVTDIQSRTKIQKELLKAAYKVLNSGGTLLYSTCSLEPEEDELIVNWVLEQYSDLSLEETNLTLGEAGNTTIFGEELHKDIAKTKKLWPHKTNTQGFFIAKFKRQ